MKKLQNWSKFTVQYNINKLKNIAKRKEAKFLINSGKQVLLILCTSSVCSGIDETILVMVSCGILSTYPSTSAIISTNVDSRVRSLTSLSTYPKHVQRERKEIDSHFFGVRKDGFCGVRYVFVIK